MTLRWIILVKKITSSIADLKAKIEAVNNDNPDKSILTKQLNVPEQETCEFCHKPYKNMIDEAGWDLGIDSDTSCGIKNFDLVMPTSKGFASTPANYCPKCGRKLF